MEGRQGKRKFKMQDNRMKEGKEKPGEMAVDVWGRQQ